MELRRESFIKIYRGTRIVGRARPVVLVTGDTTHEKIPFSESYMFHDLKGVSFLFGRTRCTIPDETSPFDFGGFAEVFSAASLLASEFRRACDHFQYAISELNKELHRDLFCYGSPLVFEETDDAPFVEFKLFQQFAKERAAMFEFTRSVAVRKLGEKLSSIPEMNFHREPMVQPKS